MSLVDMYSYSEVAGYAKTGFITALGLTTQQFTLLMYFLVMAFQMKLGSFEKMLYSNIANTLFFIGFTYWRWGSDASWLLAIFVLILMFNLILLFGFFKKIFAFQPKV